VKSFFMTEPPWFLSDDPSLGCDCAGSRN